LTTSTKVERGDAMISSWVGRLVSAVAVAIGFSLPRFV
jgi:hypothetical protein